MERSPLGGTLGGQSSHVDSGNRHSGVQSTAQSFHNTAYNGRESNLRTDGGRPSNVMDTTTGTHLMVMNTIDENPLNVTAGPLTSSDTAKNHEEFQHVSLGIDVRATAEFQNGHLKY